jgi:hypothetical protein
MHGSKKRWLSLWLLLFVLATPLSVRADYGTPTGGSDGGDPDNPYGRICPGQRAGGVGRNDGEYRRPVMRSDSWLMRRYLTLLTSLRSYYLRF